MAHQAATTGAAVRTWVGFCPADPTGRAQHDVAARELHRHLRGGEASLQVNTVVDETRPMLETTGDTDSGIAHFIQLWVRPDTSLGDGPGGGTQVDLDVVRSVLGCADVIEVDEVVHLDDPCPDGPGARVKRMGLLAPVPGLDAAEFAHRYRSGHVPLVLAQGPGFHRYVTHLVRAPDASPWSAMVQQWFSHIEAVRAHVTTTREHKPEVRRDIARFASRTRLYVVRESPLIRV